jgi:hypothetical protein
MTDIFHCHSPVTVGIDRFIAEVDYFKGEVERKGTRNDIKGGEIKKMGKNDKGEKVEEIYESSYNFSKNFQLTLH